MNNEKIIELVKPNFYSRFNNMHKKGSVVIYLKPIIELYKLCNEGILPEFIKYIGTVVTDALELSKKIEPPDPTIISFLDLKGIYMSDLNTKTKKLIIIVIQHLQSAYVDVMNKIYIYNPPVFIRIGYKIFYNFIDPDTRKKIDIVYKNKQVININDLSDNNDNNKI
tara:strand:- start:204 stop:704 length:501 start_codon:yes stop_codon:yes gene_type:complete